MPGLEFLYPSILAGAAAVAVPILIHWMMRPKPRRMIFPALRFLQRTQKSSLTHHRIRHWLLLAARILIILLIALLMAQPVLWGPFATMMASDPVAAVLVVDNSASMNVEYRHQTLLEQVRRQALKMIDSLPKGSQVAIVPSQPAGAGETPNGSWMAGMSQAEIALAELPATEGHASLRSALIRSASLLQHSPLARRELIVLADMTASAWRDGGTTDLPENTQVTVVSAFPEALFNLQLEPLETGMYRVATGAKTPVRYAIRSSLQDCETELRVELDGRTVERKLLRLNRGQVHSGEFILRMPDQPGVLSGKVSAELPDALPEDNVQYFSLQCDHPSRVWIVGGATSAADARREEKFLLSSAIAPRGRTDEPFPWFRREARTLGDLSDPGMKDADLILLANVAGLSSSQWARLEQYVRGGGGLWVVPGDAISPDSFNHRDAQRVLPATIGPVEHLSEPLGWEMVDPNHPLLEPFGGERNPSLSAVSCSRRLGILSMGEEVEVVLRYPDQAPALMVRKIGTGQVIFWNFSPSPEWSNLATLPQFPVLVQRIVRWLCGWSQPAEKYFWGQTVMVSVPPGMDRPDVSVLRPGDPVERAETIDTQTRQVALWADRLGCWSVRFSQGGKVEHRGFAVNRHPEESRFDAVSAEQVAGDFSPREVSMMTVGDSYDPQHLSVRRLELTVVIFLLLILLIIAESYLANRFYRDAGSEASSEFR